MKTFFATAAVLGVGLAMLLSGNEAAAKGGNNSSVRSSSGMHSQMHGQSYQGNGYAMHRSFNSWSSYRWNSRFGCYYYCCPSRGYYYWYAPACCYYPISYIDNYPPSPVQYQASAPGAIPLPMQVSVTSINQNGQNGLPPAGLPGPVGPVGPGR